VDATSTPIIVPAPTEGNLAGLVTRNAARHPDRVVFGRRVGDAWQDVTSAQWRDEVWALAKGFVAAGVEPGERVGILSSTRYEWTLTDFALWTAGAVGVPVYETSSAEQIAWILEDSGASAVVVEKPEHAASVASVRDRLPGLRHVWTIDDGGLDELVAAGHEVADEVVEERANLAGPSDLATIIYTSGTTGRPKGAELTHSNFMALSDNTRHYLPEVVTDDASTIMFLPLAHVFGRLIQVLVVDYGLRMGHTASIKNLMADLASFRPTFLLVVPRVLEKVYVGAESKAEAGGTHKIFHAAARVAIAHSRATDQGRVPVALRLQHALYDRLVYGKLRDAMGGRVRYVVSGGAPLGPRLAHFFRGIGVTVLEGYGLTETTAPMSVNDVPGLKIGTVGRPMPGVECRVAEDGELLTRGVNVFRGYHGNPEATAEAFVDGWFRTGDLGSVDDTGHVRITGRKKEIIVTAGGKNVVPGVLEDRLRSNPVVSQCVVVGEKRPFVGALVTLDEEMWPGWAARHGLGEVDFADAPAHPRVRKEIEAAVAHANEAVSRAESIREFAVLDQDFTEANGYLTPSLKVKRHLVLRDFAPTIDAMYGGPVSDE